MDARDRLAAFRRGDWPWVLGHRGAAALAPENTLAAVRAGRRAGADGIEIDVRATRDGALSVIHDATLARLAARPEHVRDLLLSDLRGARVGGEPIPTLVEVLDEAEGLLVNVELKSDPKAADLAPRVADQLRSRQGDRVLVSSFDPWVLRRLRKVAPEIPTGLLMDPGRPPWLYGAWLRRLAGVRAIHPHTSLCHVAAIARWRAAGLLIVAWTANDAAEVRRLDQLGVDVLIADDPAQARAALRAS